jgi:3-dehydroquinate dehydratase-2
MNMLGIRETSIYGTATLAQINESLQNLASSLKVDLEILQSNSEGVLIDAIHKCLGADVKGILINPTAYAHTSIALRDAMKAVALPFVEVHMTNTFSRESYRHQSYLLDIASGVVIGFGQESYLLGLSGLVNILKGK